MDQTSTEIERQIREIKRKQHRSISGVGNRCDTLRNIPRLHDGRNGGAKQENKSTDKNHTRPPASTKRSITLGRNTRGPRGKKEYEEEKGKYAIRNYTRDNTLNTEVGKKKTTGTKKRNEQLDAAHNRNSRNEKENEMEKTQITKQQQDQQKRKRKRNKDKNRQTIKYGKRQTRKQSSSKQHIRD